LIINNRFNVVYHLLYSVLIIIFVEKRKDMEKIMTITITNNDGLKQVSGFSENKIKHITETNQWDYVIKTILETSNKN
jgi:hypothetical protein